MSRHRPKWQLVTASATYGSALSLSRHNTTFENEVQARWNLSCKNSPLARKADHDTAWFRREGTALLRTGDGILWKPRLSSFWRLCQTCCGRWCQRLLLQPNILKVKRTSETPILWHPIGLNLSFIILYFCAVPLEIYRISSRSTYDKCRYQ